MQEAGTSYPTHAPSISGASIPFCKGGLFVAWVKFADINGKFGEQGWCSDVRALASHQRDLGSIPGRGLSLLFFLVLIPKGFSYHTSVFPSPQTPTFPNSNSTWKVSINQTAKRI